MITTSFLDDLKYIEKRLKEKKHFGLARFADGEYAILNNKPITNVDGWTYEPDRDKVPAALLKKALYFEDPDYIVGISCPCCDLESAQYYRQEVKTSLVTWSNIFVNGNYTYFLKNIIPLFESFHKIVVTANQSGLYRKLPFPYSRYIALQKESWRENPVSILTLVENLAQELENAIFLFAGGPLSDMAVMRGLKTSKKNTYLDIGSTLDKWIIGKPTRGYLKNNNNKICTW